MKECNRCGVKKKNAEFLKGPRGLGSFCALCRKKQYANRRLRNKEKLKAANREWARKNPEKIVENFTRWSTENYGSPAAYHADWRRRNPGKMAEYSRRWRERQRARRAEERRAECKEAWKAFLLGERDDAVWQTEQLVGSVDNGNRTHSKRARKSTSRK